mmetsp:Transcript_25649/g.51357  ORF Transcript_25649/g.51357 Transcript_25649/m.51357 type:complete len:284 (-) Transcript_25649:53-904(-)
MVRPRGSFQNKQLALEFAESVTVAHPSQASKVARAGQYSLFEVFARCCPWAVRTSEGGPRDGLTFHEFNKLLESHDFLKVRKSPPAPGSDPSENFADPSNPDYTGAYAFAKLRWRDPLDCEDCEALVEGRRCMQVLFCGGGAHQIASEEQFLAIVLDAKVEGDRQNNISGRSTPRCGSPTGISRENSGYCRDSSSLSCDLDAPADRKRRAESDVEESVDVDCKRQRMEPQSFLPAAFSGVPAWSSDSYDVLTEAVSSVVKNFPAYELASDLPPQTPAFAECCW